MNRFRARNRSEAVLAADPERVWGVLTDPDLLARLTPYLEGIEADGDRWTWTLTRIPVLHVSVVPTFTEVMTFDKPTRIVFAHDPQRPEERTGVEGVYTLRPEGTGTHVSIDLEVWTDLPLPRVSRVAVETVMHGVVSAMGHRFAHNMLRHLGE